MKVYKNPTRNTWAQGGNASLEAQIRQFEALLEGGFVDLSSVCREIRSQPRFENLAIELTFALGLAARGTSLAIEESIVLLGTRRLRALTYAWFLLQCRETRAAVPSENVGSARESVPRVAVGETSGGRWGSRPGRGDDSAEDPLSDVSLLIEKHA